MRPVDDSRCYICGALTDQERRLVSVESSARICRVSRATIYRWMREGRVEWVVLPGGRRRVWLDSLFGEPPFVVL